MFRLFHIINEMSGQWSFRRNTRTHREENEIEISRLSRSEEKRSGIVRSLIHNEWTQDTHLYQSVCLWGWPWLLLSPLWLFSNYCSISLSVQILAERCQNTGPPLIIWTDSLIDCLTADWKRTSSTIVSSSQRGQRTPVVCDGDGGEGAGKRD